MKLNIRGLTRTSIPVILFALTILFALGYTNYQQRSTKYPGAPYLPFSSTEGYLTVQQIREKFNCDRNTLDALATDMFCDWPKLYNNPTSFTNADYYEYLGCKDVLEPEPTLNGGVFDERREICKDGNRLAEGRRALIKEAQDLKAEKTPKIISL